MSVNVLLHRSDAVEILWANSRAAFNQICTAIATASGHCRNAVPRKSKLGQVGPQPIHFMRLSIRFDGNATRCFADKHKNPPIFYHFLSFPSHNEPKLDQLPTKILFLCPLPMLSAGRKRTSQIDGLVQERRNSIANALELCLSYTNPLKCSVYAQQPLHQFAISFQHYIFRNAEDEWSENKRYFEKIWTVTG